MIFGLGANIDCSLKQHFSKRKKIPLPADSFNSSNIIKSTIFLVNLNRQNLAKNISPSPKGLIGFISFGGAIFFWGLLKPPKPMSGYVPDVLARRKERKHPQSGTK